MSSPSFFSEARDYTIDGGTFNAVGRDQINITNTSNPNDILMFVGSHAAPDAFYDSEQRFPPPNCLPGTRTTILADLEDWIVDRSTNKRAYWIQGRAGVGKSAITQNLSEKYARPLAGETHPRLAASFFFSRSDATRDKLDPFVATIVYQFLRSEPLREVLGSSIIEAIRSDPKIFKATSETQFQKLILEPCSKVEQEVWNTLPNVVVIDGIDECVLIPSQERLIAMICEALSAGRLMFVIASRPEPRICRAFDHVSFTSFLRRLTVGDSDESTQDIATYFHQRFARLQDTHHALRHLDISWPGEDVVWRLVGRACGQFIFAITVMKYLESDDDDPADRLEDILRIRADDLPESPYPDLDLLYHQILTTCPHWGELRKVLCLIVTIPNVELGPDKILINESLAMRLQDLHCSIECIAALLLFKPGKVRSLLIKLHAVLEVPDDDKGEIRIPHATFSEFLLDPRRSTDHHVERYTKSEYYDLVAQAFLRAISVRSQEYWHGVCNSTIGWHFMSTGASLLRVFVIVPLVVSPSTGLLGALNEFDPYPFVAAQLHLSNDWGGGAILSKEGSLVRTIQWAKSLSPQVPQKFIDKMEAFMPAFYIVSPSLTLWEVKIYIEERLYISSGHGLGLWSELLGLRDFSRDKDSFIVVVPADLRPPPSWQIITITCERADAVDQLLSSLLSYCDSHNLINDIHNDTDNSIRYCPHKQHDLCALKELAAQCRKEKDLIQDDLAHDNNDDLHNDSVTDKHMNLTPNVPKEHKFTKGWCCLMVVALLVWSLSIENDHI
ncbi:hypothetical protein VNI00_014251 [Paramarasmius palmivorus]|uniref:NACHT domain-containing protein n=1 Tax=Paramarasmius palmivorus TaxID=297713 RepID=A0AAW0BU31_9AGAR